MSVCCCVKEAAWKLEHLCVALMGIANTCYFHFFGSYTVDKGLSDKLFGTLCVCWVIQDKFGLVWYCVSSQFISSFSSSALTSKVRRDICYLDFLLSLSLEAIKTNLIITMKNCPVLRSKTHLRLTNLLMRAVGHCACLAVCSFVCYARKRAKPDRLETQWKVSINCSIIG